MSAAPEINSARRRLLAVAVLLAVIPYLNSLHGEFTFDDPVLIRDNPLVSGDGASALRLFTTPYRFGPLEPMYRPVTLLSYFLNAHWANSLVAYHAVNVALHAMVTAGALLISWVLLDSALGALVTAALFAVHPIHTEAVASIVGRAELLAAACVLAALLAVIRAERTAGTARLAWRAASLTAVALGLLSKESAIVAIPLGALISLWVQPVPRLHPTIRMLVPYLAVASAYMALRRLIVGSLTVPSMFNVLDNPLAHVDLLPRLRTAIVVLWDYLSQMVVPLRLSADYSFDAVPIAASVLDPRFVVAVGALSTLGVALIVYVRRAPVLGIAAAFTVVPLALTANIFFLIGTIKAERLLYLPSLGCCLAAGWWVARQPRQRRWLVIVGVVVVAYAVRTWIRNADWQNDFTLFSAAVETTPRSAKAHYNLAIACENRGETALALRHFREALAIYPLDADAAFGVGRMYEKRNQIDAALEAYTHATQLNWHVANAHLNIGAIHYKRHDYAAAESSFRAGLESEPANPRLLIGLSLALWAQGDEAQAAAVFAQIRAPAADTADTARLMAEARAIMQRKAGQ